MSNNRLRGLKPKLEEPTPLRKDLTPKSSKYSPKISPVYSSIRQGISLKPDPNSKIKITRPSTSKNASESKNFFHSKDNNTNTNTNTVTNSNDPKKYYTSSSSKRVEVLISYLCRTWANNGTHMSTSHDPSPSRPSDSQTKLLGRKFTCIPKPRILVSGTFASSKTPTLLSPKFYYPFLIFNLPNTVSSQTAISKLMLPPLIRALSGTIMRIESLSSLISPSQKTVLNGRKSPTLESLMDMEARTALTTSGTICTFLSQNRKGTTLV